MLTDFYRWKKQPIILSTNTRKRSLILLCFNPGLLVLCHRNLIFIKVWFRKIWILNTKWWWMIMNAQNSCISRLSVSNLESMTRREVMLEDTYSQILNGREERKIVIFEYLFKISFNQEIINLLYLQSCIL